MSDSRPSNSPNKATLFWLIQAMLVVVAAVWSAQLIAGRTGADGLPPLRNVPLDVVPLYDDPSIISDQQLRDVLLRMALRRKPEGTKINHVDHALRMWGSDAQFADQELLSGREMRALLADHRRFADHYGAEAPPLLIDTPHGVRVRVQEGIASSSHHDHTLATLAEICTPLDFEIHTPRGAATLRHLLERALKEFRPNQPEYEWSALAATLYLPPARDWVTSEGQKVTFDLLSERLMREDLSRGVCAAHHRMHALVMILRVDETHRILEPSTRGRVLDYLRSVTERLVATQHPEGFWEVDWASPRDDSHDSHRHEGITSLADRILATGHPLEWWALAPAEVLPPRDVLLRAAAWLSTTFESQSNADIERNYTYLTHAARALALWRGKFPSQVDLQG